MEEDPRESVLKEPNLLCHTLSFLGPGKLKGWLKDTSATATGTSDHAHFFVFPKDQEQELASIDWVARLHFKWSLVCKAWKSICDDHFANIIGPTLEIPGRKFCRYPRTRWICKFYSTGKPLQLASIGPLQVTTSQDIIALSQILEHFDLSRLKAFHVSFLWHQLLPTRYDDLLRRSRDHLSQSAALQQLQLELILNSNDCTHSRQEQYTQMLCHPLLSLTTLQRLHLSVEDALSQSLFLGRYNDDPTVCPNPNNLLLSNLPNLTHLKLKGAFHYLTTCAFVKLQSKTLIHPDVSGLRRMTVQCNCPQLEYFQCDSLNASGSLPHVASYTELKRLMKDHVSPPGRFGDLSVTAGTVDFPGLEVPDSCVVNIFKFGYWGNYRFESYQERVQEIRDSLLSASAS